MVYPSFGPMDVNPFHAIDSTFYPRYTISVTSEMREWETLTVIHFVVCWQTDPLESERKISGYSPQVVDKSINLKHILFVSIQQCECGCVNSACGHSRSECAQKIIIQPLQNDKIDKHRHEPESYSKIAKYFFNLLHWSWFQPVSPTLLRNGHTLTQIIEKSLIDSPFSRWHASLRLRITVWKKQTTHTSVTIHMLRVCHRLTAMICVDISVRNGTTTCH